ncbi:hypothetical protein R6Q59_010344 [Mikania micrantha]
MSITKDRKIDRQFQLLITLCWVHEAGHPTIELHIAWCDHSLQEATRGDNDVYKILVTQYDSMHSLAEETSRWVYDTGQQILHQIFPYRLEDKLCLRAGSIDTNPGRDPSGGLSGRRNPTRRWLQANAFFAPGLDPRQDHNAFDNYTVSSLQVQPHSQGSHRSRTKNQ